MIIANSKKINEMINQNEDKEALKGIILITIFEAVGLLLLMYIIN